MKKYFEDRWIMKVEDIFKEYDNLTYKQRQNLYNFLIINSIRNCDIEKKLTNEEEYKLFKIIDKVDSEKEEPIEVSNIADNIVQAFGNKIVNIKTLEQASTGEILDCIIGIGLFSNLKNRIQNKSNNYETEM